MGQFLHDFFLSNWFVLLQYNPPDPLFVETGHGFLPPSAWVSPEISPRGTMEDGRYRRVVPVAGGKEIAVNSSRKN